MARLLSLEKLRPPPDLTVSQWADSYRMLSPESSAEPGKWRTSRAPYQRGIMDACLERGVHTVVVRKSTQTGLTEAENNVLGYHVDLDPCPILVLQPNVKPMGEAYSKDRLDPMFRDTEPLRGKLTEPGDRAGKNTILHKVFPGGHLTVAGANSAASLASRPIRVLLADEIDRYPDSAGDEGDPLELAERRLETFGPLARRVYGSSPTRKSESRVESYWEQSDKRLFHLPCPHCGEAHVLRWANLLWDSDEGGAKWDRSRHRPETAHFVCETCGGVYGDGELPAMLARGEWRATAPFHGVAGFHIWAAYSPWVRLADLVERHLKAAEDPKRRQVFTNTVLGEPYDDIAEEVEPDALQERASAVYDADVPEGVLVVTAAVDVQVDRLEVEIKGWGAGAESWSLLHEQLLGDPEAGNPAHPREGSPWAQLDAILARRYGGHAVAVCCVDSGAFTQSVYKYCKPRFGRRVFATKGIRGRGPPLVGRIGRNNQLRCPLIPIGVDTAKDTVFARLQRETQEGPGACHFPAHYDREWFLQLAAERRKSRISQGRRVFYYEQTRPRNEALDLQVLNLVAIELTRIDLDELAERLSRQPEEQVQDEQQPGFRRRHGGRTRRGRGYAGRY